MYERIHETYSTPDQVTIITLCLYLLFLTLFLFYKLFLSLIKKHCGHLCVYISFLDVTSSYFLSDSMLKVYFT